MEVVHVTPVGDLIEHDTDGGECPCQPRVEDVEGGTIVVHNAQDGRE